MCRLSHFGLRDDKDFLFASARKPRACPWMKGGTDEAREGKTSSGFGGFRARSEADKPAAALAKAGRRYHGFSRGAPFF